MTDHQHISQVRTSAVREQHQPRDTRAIVGLLGHRSLQIGARRLLVEQRHTPVHLFQRTVGYPARAHQRIIVSEFWTARRKQQYPPVTMFGHFFLLLCTRTARTAAP